MKRRLNNRKEEIQEIILQGLNHEERRNILKIISLSKNGSSYSEILGELGLNTGRMNYHLRQLEGLVVRNGDRRYPLTPLGEKALSVLHSMTQNLGDGYEDYLNAAKVARNSGVASLVTRWSYTIIGFTITAMFFLTTFVYISVTSGNLPTVSYYFLAGFAIFVVLLMVWFRRWVKKKSESAQDWWDSTMGRLITRR